jgi:hypothetical protein
MAWLHDNKEDPNGHYGRFWGRNGRQVGALASWKLNEQASVARAYLDTAITVLPGDVNFDGALTAADVSAFASNWRSVTSARTRLDKLRAGDLDRDGAIDFDDFGILRKSFNDAGVVISPRLLQSMARAPEPQSWLMAAFSCAINFWARGTPS